jgi:chemotaxis protein MotB
MAIEEEPAPGVPEWVVTFGDMMSLLLTFFIMLVSLSEIKEQEKYQAMVESVRKQFGYDKTATSFVPGNAKPRNSSMPKLASLGRAQRLNTANGGDKAEAPTGDYPRVRIVRPGTTTTVGTVVYFDEHSAELSEAARLDVQTQAAVLEGKPQKIEVRGHTSLRPVNSTSEYTDNWELAYRRCRNTMQYLVDDLGFDPKRIRMSVAGANEPVYLGTDAKLLKQNPRVEVFILDEVVDDLMGTPNG